MGDTSEQMQARPRLSVGALRRLNLLGGNDKRPSIENSSSVQKYRAQEALSPVIDAITAVSPLSALFQLASYSPEAEAVMRMKPIARSGPIRQVDKFHTSELDDLRDILQSYLKPKSLPPSYQTNLTQGLHALENEPNAVGYLFSNAEGIPQTYATVLPSGSREAGAWLPSITSLVEQGNGAGGQAMRDLRHRYGKISGVSAPEASNFYRKIGAKMEDNGLDFEFYQGGLIQMRGK